MSNTLIIISIEQERVMQNFLCTPYEVKAIINPVHHICFQQFEGKRAHLHMPLAPSLLLVFVVSLLEYLTMMLRREHHNTGLNDVIKALREATFEVILL